ncbi:bromodomain-containing protein DDB G0270170-like [Aphis craccivora]|uniref:Bromodomain-containing protein DDB G0270170-like n=1 Tax=Aphis craccivora TaxID=307492 RepID=A0A6G0VUB7_APHCR|nr:bromodomain-containing protein DDB G0270170-like [Aphis craccivora]
MLCSWLLRHCDSAKTKFGIPKNCHYIWEKAIGISLNRHSRVCVKHFRPSDIVSTWVSGEGSNQISVCSTKKKLSKLVTS